MGPVRLWNCLHAMRKRKQPCLFRSPSIPLFSYNTYHVNTLLYIEKFHFNVTRQSTSLKVTWEFLLRDKPVSTYSISYSNTNNTQCFTDFNDMSGISASETIYTLDSLHKGTEYSITVTAILSDGGTAQDSVTASTLPDG